MKKIILIFFIITVAMRFAAAQGNSVQPAKAKAMYGGYIGLGAGILTDKLSEHYNTLIMLPLTIDIVYKGLVGQINFDGGWAKVSKTMQFPDGSSWNKGDNSWHSTFGFNIGYSVYNSGTTRVTPLVGYASTAITKDFWSAMNDNEPKVSAINVGFVVDFKNTFITKKNAAMQTPDSDYLGVRVTAGAYLPYDDVDPYPEYYNGATIYISVGIVNLNLF